MNYIQREKEEIIEKLLISDKIKIGQSIDYAYFKQLYELYKEKMNEVEFAEILEITYNSYLKIKNNALKAKVLKGRIGKIDVKEKEKITEELLRNRKLKPGQLIDYVYFQQLYELYKEKMSEKEFAEILELTYNSYLRIKNNAQKAKVLKGRIVEVDVEEKEKIVEELLRSSKLKPGQSIDYAYFKKLYEPYKEKMGEVEFANILGVKYFSLMSMKSNKQKVKVLKVKTEKTDKKENEKIVEQLLKSGKIKQRQLIDYAYFKELYELYREKMNEVEFAELIGISLNSYLYMKNKKGKAKILKEKIEKIAEEEKEKIVEELLISSKLKPGQLIDYTYFQQIYKVYKEKMDEVEFANILGIGYSSFMSMKNKKGKVRILKEKIEKVTEEEKEKIVEELLRSSKLKSGQLIDYTYFKQIYEPYKEKMGEVEFASILGISYTNYFNLKNFRNRAKLIDYREKKKVNRIKYILNKESRYYSKEELEKLSKKYDCSLDIIIQYILCGGEDGEYVQIYKSLLNEKGKVWIGITKCSKEFAERYAKFMMEIADKSSAKYCNKYNCRHLYPDLASDSVVYLLLKKRRYRKKLWGQ